MIRLKKAIFYNRAPFDDLTLDFGDANLTILSGINGKGKTTILSHIMDAFYEIAKIGFPNEFEGKENKYYRLSGPLWTLNPNSKNPSIVYFRFDFDGKICDYVDIRVDWKVTDEDIQQLKEKYDRVIGKLEDSLIPPPILFERNERALRTDGHIKISTFVKDNVKDLFEQNILTYFPAFRYEKPAYLNDPYQVKLDFRKDTEFSGYLPNPLEVISDLPNIANWMMDVVLDLEMRRYKEVQDEVVDTKGRRILKPLYEIDPSVKENQILGSISFLITNILSSKFFSRLRIGIGLRQNGVTRIAIMDAENNKQVYPSIFNISSGEAALLCIFGELLKQADKLNKLTDVSGIVLIDEVDKHLHIKLQKEVLPKLFTMFPNIQFIVTSHSPFLSMGLADIKESYKSKIFDLDNAGIESEPQNNKQYNEVYEMMLGEKNLMGEKLEEAYSQIKAMSKPVIITEGKTDIKHLKNAQKWLSLKYPEVKNLDLEFYDVKENGWNNSKLKTLLENLVKTKQEHLVIGIFDRDDSNYICDDEKRKFRIYTNKEGKENNVFAFNIPLVNEDVYGTRKISIEHYYNEENLKKELTKENLPINLPEENAKLKEYFANHEHGLRIYLSKEFNKKGTFVSDKLDEKLVHLENNYNRSDNNVIDCEVISGDENIALSKNAFADLVSTDWGKDFNYENFRKIFDVIKEIIDYQEP